MGRPRTRRKRRQWQYQQSVPLILGGRPAARTAAWCSGWFRVALAVGLVAAGALWFAFSPRFYILEAEVVGAQRVSAEEVFAASGLKRQHILWVDREEAAARIVEQIPSVEEAKVTCRLPANCVIDVVESPLVATWEVGGNLFWVDAAGGMFPATRPLEGGWQITGDLPVDEGGRVAADVLTALGELERLGVRPRPVLYRLGRGLVFTDGAGWRVILGEGAGMQRRLQVYAAVKEFLLARGIHPRFVDVRFPEAPYYSETNEW